MAAGLLVEPHDDVKADLVIGMKKGI